MQNQGREFVFADRFAVEFVQEFTQTVDPAIENESDPVRALSMFKTEMYVRARITIKKSLALLKSKFVSEAKKQVHRIYQQPVEGMGQILAETVKLRLQHFLEPGHVNILNREPSMQQLEQSVVQEENPSQDMNQDSLQQPVEAGLLQQKQASIDRSLAESDNKVAALQQ